MKTEARMRNVILLATFGAVLRLSSQQPPSLLRILNTRDTSAPCKAPGIGKRMRTLGYQFLLKSFLPLHQVSCARVEVNMSAIGSPSMVFPGNVTMSYHLSLDESTTQVEYEVCYSTHKCPSHPLK